MAGQTDLSTFAPMAEIDGVFVAQTGHLRCTALQLNDGQMCLFSPVEGLNESARASLARIGTVSHLLAPNHYHNKALTEYAAIFADARLCASSDAAPRLAKVTGLAFDDLRSLASKLPNGFSLLVPDGLKTGEVWLRCELNKRLTWFVVDAFSGPKMTAGSDRSDTASLLKTFPAYGVRDKIRYLDWLRRQIDQDQPTMLVPCHGSIVLNDTLPAQLLSLAELHL
jgi:hypothetical protein